MLIKITNILSDRISGLVEKAYGLGFIYQVNSNKEPIVFNNGEPLHIDLDQYKSLCFFLLNGPVTQSQRDSDVSCGVLITKKIPLRLIYFSSAEDNSICLPVDDGDVTNISGALVFQDDKALREQFKLSAISLTNIQQEYRSEIVWPQIYGAANFNLKEDQQLFALDFDLNLEGDPTCWIQGPCGEDKILDDETYDPLTDNDNDILNYN
ncbi:MAG: hypothetical protein JWO06_2690 [Bacteroidota bacterium]|nr:hypothetical protein [Bacteroidota bacterium]